MSEHFLNRRRFLLSTALAGAAGLLADGALRPAAAFNSYPMSPDLKAAYLTAKSCGSDQAYHDTITQVVMTELNKLPAPPPGKSITETVKCPLCGCPIVVTRAGA
jgi:hypothetical protein